MKNLMIFAAMCCIMSVSTNAANYISLGDTVRINPRYLDGYYSVDASMHIDGMVDDWQLNAAYPDGMTVKLVAGITPLEGMTINYVDRYGHDSKYDATLNVSAAYANISSHIYVQGYWQPYYDDEEQEASLYECYGSAKWLPGDHSMFNLNFYISPKFRSGKVVFDGILNSGPDQRGPVLQGVHFVRSTYFWVGYERGDVSGNGKCDIGDVTLLIDLTLGNEVELDEFQLAAADVNGDGKVDINDVTILIDKVLGK